MFKTTVIWFFRLFFVVAVPIFFLTLGAVILVNTAPLYESGFKRYNVSTALNVSDAQLKEVALQIRQFFNSDKEILQITVVDKNGNSIDLFDQEERAHLSDVKDLVQLGYSITMILGVAIIGFVGIGIWRRFVELSVWLRWGGIAALASMGICVVLAATNFELMFDLFHRLFFHEGTWLFDPGQSLIILFPQGFWMETGFIVGVITALCGAGFFFVGLWYNRKVVLANLLIKTTRRGRYIA